MTTDLPTLLALARAATREWSSAVWYGTDEDGAASWAARGPRHDVINGEDEEPAGPAHRRADADAAFIAACSPARVIELVERLERWERCYHEMEDALEKMEAHDAACRVCINGAGTEEGSRCEQGIFLDEDYAESHDVWNRLLRAARAARGG
jgi:hypothetical protein